MSTNALSGHGTLVAKEDTPGVFTTIGELGDVTPPELSRNEFDTTTQNENIDSYVHGVLRRSPLTFPINFIPDNATHDHLTGLYHDIITNTMKGWRLTFPDGTVWISSGRVSNVRAQAPVDGKMSADVTVRFSGVFQIDGVIYGS